MKLAVITSEESDLSRLLSQYAETTLFMPHEVPDSSDFDAVAVLGGTAADCFSMPIDLRLQVEAARQADKPTFVEWCSSIGYCYPVSSKGTVSDRMIWLGKETGALHRGDLLDDRANSRILYDRPTTARLRRAHCQA